ncbi:hypothetical protein Micr_00594 [Candidatus Micrarchaeum sp.]|jgi:hypothetical protein|uniref:hypothetical protein n=1 Tax=Candidatus Micrarchaeum sp. TaxID=2282148 RepID=UPI00092C242A|nr:hypothetical protein [Candidatus Micrarchaeum sp.]OJT94595.1 MAG: hypothetical protein JJ59_00585 [Candidatus Micrarchaeum sp. AZ1]OWP53196.1 MAG: hypothetical protein B2I19_04725 [Thermoplasmatales archaeon ARMAN]QRF74066.1 hypothetical protein Micr_00594 [Candidatus Micrarchaeum sp.]
MVEITKEKTEFSSQTRTTFLKEVYKLMQKYNVVEYPVILKGMQGIIDTFNEAFNGRSIYEGPKGGYNQVIRKIYEAQDIADSYSIYGLYGLVYRIGDYRYESSLINKFLAVQETDRALARKMKLKEMVRKELEEIDNTKTKKLLRKASKTSVSN